MKLIESTVNKNYIFKGKIINVRCDDAILPNGKPCTREVVDHPGGVCIAALNNNNEILFVKQFRYPYMDVILELPAGKLSPGEDPLACGIRELAEETGAVAENYISLGTLYPSPGYCGEIIHMYMATITGFNAPSPDEDEFVEVIPIKLETAVKMVMDGKIKDAKSQIAILKLFYLKQQHDAALTSETL